MADVPPKELTDAIAEGRPLIVCGAGVSRAATDGAARSVFCPEFALNFWKLGVFFYKMSR
jgi:hypothetical protein